MRPVRDPLGFSLVELLTVVVLVGVLASLAYPAVDGMISRMRTRAALNGLAADLYYARMLAVRSGYSVVVRFPPSPRCTGTPKHPYGTDRYAVVVKETPARVVKSVVLSETGGLCLEMNQSDSVRFDARGLLRGFGNRSVIARRNAVSDSFTVSRAGRVLRRF